MPRLMQSPLLVPHESVPQWPDRRLQPEANGGSQELTTTMRHKCAQLCATMPASVRCAQEPLTRQQSKIAGAVLKTFFDPAAGEKQYDAIKKQELADKVNEALKQCGHPELYTGKQPRRPCHPRPSSTQRSARDPRVQSQARSLYKEVLCTYI